MDRGAQMRGVDPLAGWRSARLRTSGVPGEEGMMRPRDVELLRQALEEARTGEAEGGIPIGAVLAIGGRIVGRGHNQRVQRGSATLHGEIACLENAGRLPASRYARATLYTTLSPCPMCSGAVLLYEIPRVVVGENRTFMGSERLLRARGVEVVVADDAGCRELLQGFIARHPEVWAEDIGVSEAAVRRRVRAWRSRAKA